MQLQIAVRASERARPEGGKLFGKVVVVTGASSGLGRATALELARRGARVVVASRRADTLEDTASLCREAGAQVLAVVTDVTSEADVARLAERAQGLTGSVDVWINNASVTAFGTLHALFPRAVERVIHDALGRWHFSGGQQLDAAGNLWTPSEPPASMHGERRPRIDFPSPLGWVLGHYGVRGLCALSGF
jgi:uncharacterized protein YbjT (DUF2867 family)